jgi:diadenosine tetraphosphate (Ap4A) HIT family hydrolase
MNESRYPWLILVPERAGVTEIFELNGKDQIRLIQESSRVARHLKSSFNADKLNVAAIGNLVPQLHIHHVARFRDDSAWPAPVWGRFEPNVYTAESLAILLERLNLPGLPGFLAANAG